MSDNVVAKLHTEPGSSTPKQRQRLHQLKRRHGWTDEDLHEAIGKVSTKLLSSAEASALIRRLGGGKLPYPPGEKPAPYAGRRSTPGATRMIADGHVEQIQRLLSWRFDGDAEAAAAWLHKNFDVTHPRDLLTARRAGQVIRVLKDMIARRDESVPSGVEST